MRKRHHVVRGSSSSKKTLPFLHIPFLHIVILGIMLPVVPFLVFVKISVVDTGMIAHNSSKTFAADVNSMPQPGSLQNPSTPPKPGEERQLELAYNDPQGQSHKIVCYYKDGKCFNDGELMSRNIDTLTVNGKPFREYGQQLKTGTVSNNINNNNNNNSNQSCNAQTNKSYSNQNCPSTTTITPPTTATATTTTPFMSNNKHSNNMCTVAANQQNVCNAEPETPANQNKNCMAEKKQIVNKRRPTKGGNR